MMPRYDPTQLSNGQIRLLNLLKNQPKLPEMFPLKSGEYPEIPVTFDELSELKRVGLVLFVDHIKNMDNKAINSYCVSRGTDLCRYEQRIKE